jgi:phosphatidylserine/phosphatidylglycerophosphate/cardiolipin synthase-like enzyme
MATAADAQKWLLQWSTTAWGLPTWDGRPWGDRTELVKRSSQTTNPWDTGCKVTPLIGGYETMCSVRDTLEAALADATSSSQPAGQRGHVYMTGWRMNPLRDLSDSNAWVTSPWASGQTATRDQTLIGFVLRLMQAGVNVRILPWLPITGARAAGFRSHILDEWFLAEVVAKESARLNDQTRGLVGLDLRVAQPLTASHHQKMIVVRVGNVNVAYCGGVDLAFTRRDAPIPDATKPNQYKYDPAKLGDVSAPAPQFLDGDWESGNAIPAQWNAPVRRWPQETGSNSSVTRYSSVYGTGRSSAAPSDLPQDVYGGTNHLWHDQHLRLEGPIVSTLEEQFIDRWKDSGVCHDLGVISGSHYGDGQTIFSSSAAFQGNTPIDLATVNQVSADPSATAIVQMWRTIPMRPREPSSRFQRGEYTVMAGLSKAIGKASELIWLFDQYFWSRPTARLLNSVLRKQGSTVRVILVLPPYADDQHLDIHHARKLALNDLIDGLKPAAGRPGLFGPAPTDSRVAVYDTWRKGSGNDPGIGIYVHAKTKMFDDKLLVCGSANINERSHTCDTELDCAVLDEQTLDVHQRRLWKVFFPGKSWPSSFSRNQSGWGARFFNEFSNAAAELTSNLIPDPWWTEKPATVTKISIEERDYANVVVSPPTLPNQVKREQDYAGDFLTAARTTVGDQTLTADNIYLRGQAETESVVLDKPDLLNPLALRTNIETATAPGPRDPRAPGRLDEIVYLIEGVAGKDGDFPFRRARTFFHK